MRGALIKLAEMVQNIIIITIKLYLSESKDLQMQMVIMISAPSDRGHKDCAK